MTVKTTRTFSRRTLLALPLALGLCGCPSEVDGAGGTLYFSAIPGENTTEMIEKFGAVAEYLSSELGVPVEYKHVSDYVASVDAFKNGDIHLSWFGGLTGVRARRAVPGARAIAQGQVDPRYKSYFIANSSSGLTPSEEFPFDLAGKTFTFGNRSSTSGRLMPEHFMRTATGKSPQEFLGSEMSYQPTHDLTWQLVQDGTFDAGVMSYVTYDKRVKEGKIDPLKCFILWTTPEYADYSWNAHPALEDLFGSGFTERLQTALINMRTPALLDAMMREDGLIPASNTDFTTLEELAEELDLLR